MALGRGPARLGQRERPASVAVLDRDETLVLELLEGRIDRSGARAPAAAAALAELLHDLVAVHRLLGQERQGRFADRAAARVKSAAPAVTVIGVAVAVGTATVGRGRSLIETGEAARTAGAGRLDRDGVLPRVAGG